MKYNDLTWPGKMPYRTPVSEALVLKAESFLCASDKGGTTEEWEEYDLSTL